MKWCDADLLALDRIYAESGVAFHARPLRAAADLLGSEFVLGVVGNSEAEEIMDAYQRLIPEVSTSWPGMGIGLAVSVDRVRKVVVAVALGQPAISLEQGLGFASRSEWQQWCRDDPVIAAGNAFAFADIYDLTYGLNELEGGNAVAIQYWRLALSNLEDVANSLFSGYSVASISQPICMTAKLAMKGALIHLGDDPAELAKGRIGHRHSVLAERLAKACPHRDDSLLTLAASKLPDYVGSRYRDAGLTRLDVVKLAVGVQFIAASSVRRISGRDFAQVLEQDQWPGPRTSIVG